jgi:hypothetical protein
MDDRNLATLGRLDQLRVGAGCDVRDICLLVLIVGELPLEVTPIPEQDPVEVLAPNGPDVSGFSLTAIRAA